MKRTLMVACVLLLSMASTYASISKFPLMFSDGTWDHALTATGSCTSQTFITYPGRAFSTSWQQYTRGTTSDSTIVKLYFRVTLDSSSGSIYWSKWDTLPTQVGYNGMAYGALVDTFGSVHNIQQGPFAFFPPVSYWGQFRLDGVTGNSDSSRIKRWYVGLDDLR